MTNLEYRNKLRFAEIQRRQACGHDMVSYWVLYMSGLKRGRYGRLCSTDEAHAESMALCDSTDAERRMLGAGYRDGFNAFSHN